MVDKSDKKNHLFLFNLIFYVGVITYFLFGIIPAIIIVLIPVVYFLNRELLKNEHTILDLFGSDGSKIRQEQVTTFLKNMPIKIGPVIKEKNIEGNKDVYTSEITSSQKEEIKNEMAYTILKSVLNQQDKRGLFIMIKGTLIFFFITVVVTTLINSGGLGIDIGFGKMRDTLSAYIISPSSNQSIIARVFIGIILLLVIVKVMTDLKKAQPPKPLPEGKIEKPGI